MSNIAITNPTGRKTPCNLVTIGNVELLFSYETLIGIRSPGQFQRLENVWGPTTGRHINESGFRNAMIVDETTLQLTARYSLKNAI